MTDDEFRRLLYKQMEEQKRDKGLTTVRSLERRDKERQQKRQPKKLGNKN